MRDIVLEEASPIASTWIGAERALHALLSGKEPITDRLLLEPLAVVPGANGYARYARFMMKWLDELRNPFTNPDRRAYEQVAL